MMFNNEDQFAVILELYYESMKIDETIGQSLYGSSTSVRYDDGLFGKITKLFNIIKVNIHDSWKNDLLCEEDKKELLNIVESCPVGAIVIEEEKEA